MCLRTKRVLVAYVTCGKGLCRLDAASLEAHACIRST